MIASRPFLPSAGLTIALFASLGAASRLHFRMTETRWQILAFVAAAVLAEAGWSAIGVRPSRLRALLGASAATLAILCAKYHLEPQSLHAETSHAAHIARASARAILR